MVDARPHLHLASVAQQFARVTGWRKLLFFCGKGSSALWRQILAPVLPPNVTVQLIELPVTSLSPAGYSDILKSARLWASIDTEWALVVQLDSWAVGSTAARCTLSYFVSQGYALVGGNQQQRHKWKELPRFLPRGVDPAYLNFNGGLSLRRVPDMRAIVAAFPPRPTVNDSIFAEDFEEAAEDVYFTVAGYSLGLRMGDDEDAQHFAVHQVAVGDFFGLHKATLNVVEALEPRPDLTTTLAVQWW